MIIFHTSIGLERILTEDGEDRLDDFIEVGWGRGLYSEGGVNNKYSMRGEVEISNSATSLTMSLHSKTTRWQNH